MSEPKPINGTARSIWTALGILVTILISAMSFAGMVINENKTSIAGNMQTYTNKINDVELRNRTRYEQIMIALKGIEVDIQGIKGRRIPPKWLENKAEDHKIRIRNLERKK